MLGFWKSHRDFLEAAAQRPVFEQIFQELAPDCVIALISEGERRSGPGGSEERTA